MFKVKLGQPRNKQLLRMMEDPEKRKAIDKAELSFYQDTRKEELFALKEELFFTIDEKSNESDLSEQGRAFLNPDDPDSFVLPDLISEFTEIDLNRTLSDEEKEKLKVERQQHCDAQAERIHNISQLLRAYCLFEKDVQYVVEENKVVIVDEYTGRKMPGRRWSDGLHQAVEAKEGVQIDRETQTLATITIQNYFRLYHKLAGMTGTAETEAAEFHDIYKLDVNVIPTNRPVARKDANDRIYKTRREKYNAVINEIKDRHAKAQPVLVGTVSVEASRVAQPDAEARESSAQRSEREVSHAGSGDRAARRAGRARSRSRRTWPAAAPTLSSGQGVAGSRRTCSSSAPSATNRAGSIASCADVARARAIRAARVSTSASKTTSCATSARPIA